MDCISLMGVECRVRLGVPDRERKKPQKVLLDLELELPLAGAGRSDNVRDTADYREIEERVRKTAEYGEFRLAERLGYVVADTVLKTDWRIRSVRVAVRKRPAVMPRTREIVVAITRIRR